MAFVKSIRSSEKFISFYKKIMDARYFLLYIILSSYVWSILFYQTKDHNVRQIKFHVCIKMTLFGQPNNYNPKILKEEYDITIVLYCLIY